MEEEFQIRLREQFLRAWRDVMEAKMREDPPDYDWVVRSYVEVRQKLSTLMGRRKAEVEETMDVELFEQMIRNQAFQGPEFLALINYTFGLCLQLGAPSDDSKTNEKKNEVMEALNTGEVFAKLIPLYFENINICIETIFVRIRDLRSQ